MGRAKKTDSREINKKIESIKGLIIASNNKKNDGINKMLDGDVFRHFVTDDGAACSQEDIIRSLLAKKDTFSILPTGTGKSLCFQMAACFSEGLTVVITPLVALIADQVDTFNKRYAEKVVRTALGDDVPTPRAASPGIGRMTTHALLDDIATCRQPGSSYEYKLLYVSPERLANEKFRRLFAEYINPASPKHIHISNIIIDEVHCMSQWGFDFRESYLRIPEFVSMLQDRPVIGAFTATATPVDISDICTVLDLTPPSAKRQRGKRDCNFFICYDKRSNLYLHVIDCLTPPKEPLKSANATKSIKPKKPYPRLTHLRYLLKANADKPCIIYCSTVAQVETLCTQLKSMKGDNFSPLVYHAQLSRKKREENAYLFENGKAHILIATLAYGMGIDIGNIAMIVHYDVPRSLEEYYQEVGRAGRDRQCEAQCYLLYTQTPRYDSDGYDDNTDSANGTFIHTLNWYFKDIQSHSIEAMPIASHFSEEIIGRMHYMELLRLAMVRWYCNTYKAVTVPSGKENNDCHETQDSVLSFLRGTIDIETVVKEFLEFAKNNMPAADFDIVSDILSYSGFNGTSNPYENSEALLSSQAGIVKALREINDLHINNTAIANLIRWHPERIKYNTPDTLTIREWKKASVPSYSERAALATTDIREDTLLLLVPKDSGNPDRWYDIDFIQTLLNESTAMHKKAALLLTIDERYVVRAVYRYSGSAWKKGLQSDIESFISHSAEELLPWSLVRNRNTGQDGDKQTGDRNEFLLHFVPGQRVRTIEYELSSTQPIDYFDMCILDAIYSLIINRRPIIYVKNIWEILSGNPDVHFSRAGSKIQSRIEEGIERLCRVTIRIEDDNLRLPHGGKAVCEAMLNLRRRSDGERGYDYSPGYVPVLFRYAENINGEIIKIPTNLLNYGKLEKIVKQTPSCRNATIENAVLTHYILHRKAIANKTHRGKHINPATFQRITAPYVSKSADIAAVTDKYSTIVEALELIGF